MYIQNFWGSEFKAHTTCISEAEKYQGALYKAKPGKTKADPQEVWTNLILSMKSDDKDVQWVFE
jgi:cell growth-regulating nucleolar protein